ncbi:10617_t:CDS:1, partial [Entrophospora sp. SA101]
ESEKLKNLKCKDEKKYGSTNPTTISSPISPISVNFHFTRRCNYECGFCFHTSKTSDIPKMSDSKLALKKLKNVGMRKMNFAGGEPFLYMKYLGELIEYCKKELKLESVSIVSNGSKITRSFLLKYKDYIDILAVSCDSFDDSTNVKIGRGKKGEHLKNLKNISTWCREFNIKFKINTVVNRYNWQEDMNSHIEDLKPFRWKCFQVLILENENGGDAGIDSNDKTLRDARDFVITDEQFQSFISRHQQQQCIVPEPNNIMKNSYLILDEHLCFLNCRDNKKIPSQSLLNVDVDVALQESGWDQDSFYRRSGVYDWSKNIDVCAQTNDKSLNW